MTVERLRRFLWVAFALLAVVLFVKFFVADVYRVSSGSMRPTIFAGPLRQGEDPLVEWVLVSYQRGRVPERFDLVVWDREGFGAVVKRVVGLPGESIRIEDGDLLIGGEGRAGRRLPAEAARPVPVVVFDSELSPVEDYFHFRGESDEGPWRRDELEWCLDARQAPAGSFQGMMSYHPELRDDYLDADGRRVVGKRVINDAIFACEFLIEEGLEEGTGRLRFLLLEKADTFELRLSSLESGDELGTSHVVELLRRSAGDSEGGEAGSGRLARVGVDLAPGQWHGLRFSNVDNHLEVRLSGPEPLLVHTYERNELHSDGRAPGADQHVGPRVEFGGEGLAARFRRVRILRDLHYTKIPDGLGVVSTQHLGTDEVFLLGDNSAQSLDSRTFGAVSVGELIGEPILVVWPPRMARRLVAR